MPRRWLLVTGTFLLSVLLYVDRACISSAKEPITKALGLTDAEFGWALSAFALGYALLQTPSGALADRLGPHKLLSGVVVLWSLFTGLTGAVSGFLPLVLVRFLFGAGEAGAFPGMARAAVTWIPLAERGRVQGINFSGSRLGAAFAMPTIAGLIAAVGWRTTFAILMGAGFVWAVLWFMLLKIAPKTTQACPLPSVPIFSPRASKPLPSRTPHRYRYSKRRIYPSRWRSTFARILFFSSRSPGFSRT